MRSLFAHVEEEVYSVFGRFTCFYAHSVDAFVIEVPRCQPQALPSLLTRSTVLHLLELARRSPASRVLLVLPRRASKVREAVRVLAMVGFENVEDPELVALKSRDVKLLVYSLGGAGEVKRDEKIGDVEEAKS